METQKTLATACTNEALAKMGVNILAVDYRGYGKSEGKPDEAGFTRMPTRPTTIW